MDCLDRRDHAAATSAACKPARCTIQLGFVLNDLLEQFPERISDHCSNIAVKRH